MSEKEREQPIERCTIFCEVYRDGTYRVSAVVGEKGKNEQLGFASSKRAETYAKQVAATTDDALQTLRDALFS